MPLSDAETESKESMTRSEWIALIGIMIGIIFDLIALIPSADNQKIISQNEILPEIRLSSFIRLRHHPSGLRLRRAYRTGCPQSDSYNTMVRVVIREIAPPVFTTSHKKPTEAKTSGDRRQSVIYGIASHH